MRHTMLVSGWLRVYIGAVRPRFLYVRKASVVYMTCVVIDCALGAGILSCC